VRPAVKVARIAGASRHSRLETEPRVGREEGLSLAGGFLGDMSRLVHCHERF